MHASLEEFFSPGDLSVTANWNSELLGDLNSEPYSDLKANSVTPLASLAILSERYTISGRTTDLALPDGSAVEAALKLRSGKRTLATRQHSE